MKQPEIIELLLTHDERGMEALLLHYGPLMRYVIAPIFPMRTTKPTACRRSRCVYGRRSANLTQAEAAGTHG